MPLKRTFRHFRLHVCHHRAITGALVYRTTSITRSTAVAKKVLLENFAKVIVTYCTDFGEGNYTGKTNFVNFVTH